MNDTLVNKPASQEEINFYCYIGEAICKIQIVEGALSYAITLKLNPNASMQEADKILKKNQGYTLGKAIKIAESDNLFDASLQKDLNHFLGERNWLVHNAVEEYRNGIFVDVTNQRMLNRIKDISDQSLHIQHTIELDMIAFCTAKGKDMSSSLAIINTRYASKS